MEPHVISEVDFCLICCTKIKSATTKTSINSEESQLDTEVTNNLLSKNLNAIFILQNLLDVPNFHLKLNLLEHGDPVNWIALCHQCTQLTGQAWNLHQQIVQFQHELNSIQNKVLEKAKSSYLSQEDADNYLGDSPEDIETADLGIISTKRQVWRSMRQFIEIRDYTENESTYLVNPFIEGDKLAKYLASQLSNFLPSLSPQDNYRIECNYPDNYSPPSSDPAPLSPDFVDPVDPDEDWVEKCETESKSRKYSKRPRPSFKPPGQDYSCEICGLSYKRNSLLIRHKRLIHKLACKPPIKLKVAYYVCKICGKQIKTKEGLKHHINITHEKRWRFFCEICGRGWPNLTTLKMHLLAKHKEDKITKKMMEKGERIWKCEVEGCAIQFFRKSTLDKHTEKYHGEDGGEKRFKCEFCEVRFFRRSDLKRHGIVHEKKKQNRAFVCDDCGKGYGSESILAIHKQSFH